MPKIKRHYKFIHEGCEIATKWCSEEEAYSFSAQWEIENGLKFQSVIYSIIEK